MLGTIALNLNYFHADPVQVWDLNAANSGKPVETLKSQRFKASIGDDLGTAAGQADIISCATLSNEPLIKFEWLRPGTHLDLIGSFTPHMREADNACLPMAPSTSSRQTRSKSPATSFVR